jgi:hypothetical protein
MYLASASGIVLQVLRRHGHGGINWRYEMLRRTFALPMIAFVLSIFISIDAAAVLTQRTFVSNTGSDSNPCTLALPCRSFAPAILQTLPSGEVVALDSAGYGPVTITQSVSIIAPPGVYAGMSVFPTEDGVTIAAGAGDKVVLRGLTINGQGGNRGIVVTSGGEVHIEGCTVANLGLHGIEINGGGRIHIRSTIVRSNGWDGLFLASGTTVVEVLDSQFARNIGNGILVNAGKLDAKRIAADDNAFGGVLLSNPSAGTPAVVTLADSVISGNVQSGASAQTNTGGSTARMAVIRTTSARNGIAGFGAVSTGGTIYLSVSDSAAVENVNGLVATGTGATAIVTRSTFAGNSSFDINQSSSAVLLTSGNNTLSGTGSNVNGTFSANPLF